MNVCEREVEIRDAKVETTFNLRNIYVLWITSVPALAHVKKISLFKVEKKNCEPLKSGDIKIIPMTLENPNKALFFLFSDWTIQCHKKNAQKRYFGPFSPPNPTFHSTESLEN